MRSSVAVAVACLSMIGLSLADHVSAAIRKFTNIEPQALAPALHLFAKERDVQLVYRSDLVGDRKTGGAVGELTIDEALTRLLHGTGLTFEYLEADGITIIPLRLSAEVGTAKKPIWDRLRLAKKNTLKEAAGDDKENQNGKEELIEMIVVTAQKREERLKDVPISISVLPGDDLDKSTSEGITESLNRVPGIAAMPFSQQGGGTSVTVRGVTAGGPVFNGSNPVAYYLDSVPFGFVKSAIAPDANAYDLERVEALRGPQGTLYGASALNGVVRVLTRDADLNEFGFKVRTSASSTGGGGRNYRGDMAVNVPIMPGKLAARMVAGYQDLSGWIDRPDRRDSNDGEISNLRLKINARPSSEFSIAMLAWRSRSDYGAPSMSNDSGRRNALLEEPTATDYDAYGLKVGYELPGVSVTSMTSYLDYTNDSGIDLFDEAGSSMPLATFFSSQVFSQEIIVNSSHVGPWRWTVGASYRDAEDRLIQGIPSVFAADLADGSKSSAIFGELSRRFYDQKLEWTLGLRYFNDDVYSQNNGSADAVSEDSFNSTTPRAVLTWFPSDDLTVYGSYSEGFRSGAIQNPGFVPSNFPSLHPDSLKNYELGAKANVWKENMTLEAALYFIDWQDVQQSLTVPFEQTIVTALINGDSASGVGLDLGVTVRYGERLELGVSFSWNDLKMDKEVISQDAVLFAKADRLNLSPEYTVGASADYVFPLGRDGFEGKFSTSANYTSQQSLRTIVGVQQSIASGDPMLVARTSFSIQSPNQWELTLYSDNVSDEHGSVYGDPFRGFPVPDSDARVRPRTVGLQFDYRF